MEIFNIEPVSPTTPEVPKEALHANNSSFLKLLLVANGIGNTPGKEGSPFAEGEEPETRGIWYCPLSHTRILRD